MAASIFISYRREDSAGEAGRLADHLEQRFGKERVFMDIDTIKPGTDFVDALSEALLSTSVVLVVIGRHWLTASNASGRRLEDPGDFVRREVEAALARDAHVIPVLVQNVTMPSAADLPPSLAPLATRQAIAIQHEEFTDDAQRLINAIAPMLAPTTESPAAATRASRGMLIGVAMASVLVLGVFAVRWRGASTARAAAAIADSARVVRQGRVDNLVKVATEQRDRHQLVDAAITLDTAVGIDADLSRAKTLQEDVAMQSIRDLSVPEGQTFTQAMAKPLAVLDRAAPFATGARQGDLLAHLAWAMSLRWRDGDRALRPAEAFQRALAVDPKNPFANVMMGHWILSHDQAPNALARATPYFRIAADAGRSMDDVRKYQMAALQNDGTPPSRLEVIRVMQEMRTRGERLTPSMMSNAWSIYYFSLNGQMSQTVSDIVGVLPPAEHLQTFRWAFAPYATDSSGRGMQFRFYVARIRAEMGDVKSALDSIRTLHEELNGNTGMIQLAVDSALKQLGRRK